MSTEISFYVNVCEALAIHLPLKLNSYHCKVVILQIITLFRFLTSPLLSQKYVVEVAEGTVNTGHELTQVNA